MVLVPVGSEVVVGAPAVPVVPIVPVPVGSLMVESVVPVPPMVELVPPIVEPVLPVVEPLVEVEPEVLP